MTIVNDVDLGPSHPWLGPQVGQQVSSVIIEGSRTLVWSRGRSIEREDVTLWVSAWQAIGGQAAGSLGAIQYLIRQLEELSGGAADPVYIQWSASAASGAYSVANAHDGWYVIENINPNYLTFIVGGFVQIRLTVSQVASASPASLGVRWAGGALTSTYTATPIPLISYPVGASGQTPTTLSRTGGEGAIQLSALTSASTINPTQFVAGTIANLFQGGVRIYDTINTGSNPVPTSGGFANANWVQVYGIAHDFVGDCVLTNGLLLLLFQVGQDGCLVYLWNTSLGTPAWQSTYTLSYSDNPNHGTVREINIDRISIQEVRLRVQLGTSTNNWAKWMVKLVAGSYAAYVEHWPLTVSNTFLQGLQLTLTNAAKIAYNDSGMTDLVNGTLSPSPTTLYGFGAAFGTQTNGSLYGFLYQNPPNTAQPTTVSSTVLGFGDNASPALNSYQLYGVFAMPWTTAQNLQAEAESGTLGTGWSSTGNANASAGHEAKAASGTASGNADLFGTSWVPPAGQYEVWFRVRVTSNTGSAAEMTLGLWDATSSAFVTGGSTTYRANQSVTTYGTGNWLHVNSTSPLTPTAGHNMQFRAVTAATLGTDWFIDEAVLLPVKSATLGQGNFPADIWAQWAFDRISGYVRG